MNLLNRFNVVRTFVVASSLAVLAACASTGNQQSMAEYLDDAAITQRVKARLSSDAHVGSLLLTVETIGRVVQLRGTAESAVQRAQAEQVTRATQGVDAVRNLLVVRRAP